MTEKPGLGVRDRRERMADDDAQPGGADEAEDAGVEGELEDEAQVPAMPSRTSLA